MQVRTGKLEGHDERDASEGKGSDRRYKQPEQEAEGVPDLRFSTVRPS